ncbi:MAG TPA: methyltransferase domain-containing protein [Ktedonobacteraceae bacterium]|nr:methyltransferase domain-containing protein [Ktedonobacteraceae bacterium]
MNKEQRTPAQAEALRKEVKDIWERNAVFWDQRMGDGNVFQRELVGPGSEHLLGIREGELVLEFGCGNGVFSRRLAQLGARVIATDVSEKMLELAQARTTAGRERIEYKVLDATDENQMLRLGLERFDAISCNMVLMDISEIDPLMRASRQLLKPEGRFVFSVMHPCFNGGSVMVMEEEDDESNGELILTHSVKISKYLGRTLQKGLAMRDQPVSQYYFHRTLQELLGSSFRAGFVLDALEEPGFSPTSEQRHRLNWLAYSEIPPVLIVRLRPADRAY